MVTSGNIDSMVAHYTAAKRLRHDDAYTAGGIAGKDLTGQLLFIQILLKGYILIALLLLVGLEASLRRFAHYDYWSDRVRKSILIDSGADLLVYGMSEKQIVEVANALNDGFEPKYIRHINGTCYVADTKEEIYDDYVEIPSIRNM